MSVESQVREMGKVAKRVLPNGDVRWDARWRDTDGKQRKLTKPTKREAEQELSRIEADLSRGLYIAPDAGKVTFRAYADEWLKGQGFDRSTHDAVELRLRLHAYPTLGSLQLRAVTPSHIRTWLVGMTMADSYKKTIYVNVSCVFSAAVDDSLIPRSPFSARSVKSPKVEARKVIPWPIDQVLALHDALPERFQIVSTIAAGLGLRQGEVFGLSPDDVDFLRGRVEVRRQVKVFGGNRLALSLPKGGKTRTVPLPSTVRDELAAYLTEYPPKSVALPWALPEGDPVTVPLVLTTREGKALNRNYVNTHIWKPALIKCEVDPNRDNGMHALRHFYASVLLDAGESVRALADYLGHSDPGFTLRVYAHVMPTSDERSRKAVDAVLGSRAIAVPSVGVSTP